jgi:predicted transcriptional regulator|tara:strand:+ start:4334 stop:4561 length:228 start_codon:yes stop_codon:yes gene_type:complete
VIGFVDFRATPSGQRLQCFLLFFLYLLQHLDFNLFFFLLEHEPEQSLLEVQEEFLSTNSITLRFEFINRLFCHPQ